MFSNDTLDSLVNAFNKVKRNQSILKDAANKHPLQSLKKVNSRILSYSGNHRDVWQRPEYHFEELQIAQDSDSYIQRSIRKKVNKLLIAKYKFVGTNPETVKYIRRRFKEFEMATGHPTISWLEQAYADIFRFNNCMLVKARRDEASTGSIRKDINGAELAPVAGLFVLPFETLEFKVKRNGEVVKILQNMKDGYQKEFSPKDVVHFTSNKKPGFIVGTPELMPVLDDIRLLRRIEENVEELIETNLFPVFHYKVGSDSLPERVSPDGRKETDIVKSTIEYLPASGVYVSDHRLEIEAIGSEGRALRIEAYLSYFKARAFTGLGVSSVDMGEGDTANRSTASTLSKGLMMDVEAAAILFEEFFTFYIINELLMEGGYDPLDEDQEVRFKFGVIDKEEKRAEENHYNQLFNSNFITMDEAREATSNKPWEEDMYERTYMKMFEEPSALVKGMGPGSAAGETLAGLPASNVTPQSVSKENTFAKQQQKIAKAGQAGARPRSSGSGSRSASASRNRPSNQHGTRSTTKTNRDTNYIIIYSKDNSSEYLLENSDNFEKKQLDSWIKKVQDRYDMLSKSGVTFETVAENMLWRLK